MTVNRWKEARGILDELLDAAEGVRASRLNTLEKDDPELAGIVRRLLALDDGPAMQDLASDAGASNEPAAWSASPAESGRREVGRFRLRHRIATGRTSSVWAADRSDGAFEQAVVIKLIDVALVADDLGIPLTEARGHERTLLARVEDPAVVRILDAGDGDGQDIGAGADGVPGGPSPAGGDFEWIALEHLDAATLLEHCESNRADLETRVRLVAATCDAVSACHDSEVMHLDVAPGNVLVTAKGAVKLIDFGSARLVGGDFDGSRPGPLTPAYAAPEQFTGAALTRRADVWALGAILYELVTGVPPIDVAGVPPAEASHRKRYDEPVAPSRLFRRCSAEEALRLADERRSTPKVMQRRMASGGLDDVILSALRRDVDRRTSSAAHLRDDLLRWCAGEPVRARRETLTQAVTRVVRSRPKVAMFGFLSAAALLSGTIALFSSSLKARAATREERHIAAMEESNMQKMRDTAQLLVVELYQTISPIAGTGKAVDGLLAAGIELTEGSLGDDSDPGLRLWLADALVKRSLSTIETPRWTRSLAEAALSDLDRADNLVAPLRAHSHLWEAPARVAWESLMLRAVIDYGLCDTPAWRADISNARSILEGYDPGADDVFARSRWLYSRTHLLYLESEYEWSHGRLGIARENAGRSLELLAELGREAPHLSANVQSSALRHQIKIFALDALRDWDPSEPHGVGGRAGLEGALRAIDEALALAELNVEIEPIVAAMTDAAFEMGDWLLRIGERAEAHRVYTGARDVAGRFGKSYERRHGMRVVVTRLEILSAATAPLPDGASGAADDDVRLGVIDEDLLGPSAAGRALISRAQTRIQRGDAIEAARDAVRATALLDAADRSCPQFIETISARADLDLVQGLVDETLAQRFGPEKKRESLERALARFRSGVERLSGIKGDALQAKLTAQRMRRIVTARDRCATAIELLGD